MNDLSKKRVDRLLLVMNRQQEKLQERFQEESQSELLGERSEYSPREFLDKRIEAIFLVQ